MEYLGDSKPVNLKVPLVSVCVATFQHFKFIEKCLQSILQQKTSFDYEILIGEDVSTDGTRELCIHYAEKHPDLIRLFLRDGEEKKSVIRGIREKWAWAERKWSQVTEDTGIGNPKKATPEKGKRYFEDVTDKVADLISDICSAKPGELYK